MTLFYAVEKLPRSRKPLKVFRLDMHSKGAAEVEEILRMCRQVEKKLEEAFQDEEEKRKSEENDDFGRRLLRDANLREPTPAFPWEDKSRDRSVFDAKLVADSLSQRDSRTSYVWGGQKRFRPQFHPLRIPDPIGDDLAYRTLIKT